MISGRVISRRTHIKNKIVLPLSILLPCILFGAAAQERIFNEPYEQSVDLEYLMYAADFANEEIVYYSTRPKPSFDRIETFASLIAEIGNINRYNAPKKDYLDWTTTQVDLGKQLAAAARAKDLEKVKTVHQQLLNNCNACHDKYLGH